MDAIYPYIKSTQISNCPSDSKAAPGIGGDSTRQVLWRMEHGEFDGITPKLGVLKIGTNHLYGDGNAGTDEEIASAFL
jgi:hypothetical protein